MSGAQFLRCYANSRGIPARVSFEYKPGLGWIYRIDPDGPPQILAEKFRWAIVSLAEGNLDWLADA